MMEEGKKVEEKKAEEMKEEKIEVGRGLEAEGAE